MIQNDLLGIIFDFIEIKIDNNKIEKIKYNKNLTKKIKILP